MTRIDFYIASKASQLSLACRVIEKIHGIGHQIYAHADAHPMASKLDEMLWDFKPDNFLAHEMVQPDATTTENILIGYQQPPEGAQDVLVNLTSEVPLFFNQFQRVAEVVGPDEELKLLARARYKYYRENGYELYTHNL
ncbi:MAG: DNA polymerase III subunit chi [Methylococcales bacterium]|jgi:DNA polymerase III subunit chi|nr:DNA polymerase III subunit chi [Methylococcales bacterium]